MSFEFLEQFTLFSTASVLLPLVIGIVTYSHHQKSQRLLFYLVVASVLTEVLAYTFSKVLIPNVIVYNSYTFINFNIIFLIYLEISSPHLKITFITFQIVFNIFMVANAMFIQAFTSFNSNSMISASVVFLLLALYHFYKLLKEVKYQRLEKNPLFWLSSGLIIYYSATLILFLYIDQISKTDQANVDLHLASWGLNSFFNLLRIAAFSIALWVRPTK